MTAAQNEHTETFTPRRTRASRLATPSERADRIAEAMGIAPFPSTFFNRGTRLLATEPGDARG